MDGEVPLYIRKWAYRHGTDIPTMTGNIARKLAFQATGLYK